ncbi:C40 family peptidase [Mucilaginibacter hurinus]|nr:C40 family peptidase [Mucilaginibacter hurinus]
MEYGICNLAIAPLRAEPTERAEQTSQVLFGEAFEILEWQEHWVKIITAYDNYTGWIGRLLFELTDKQTFDDIKFNIPAITNSPVTWAFKKSDMSLLYLPFGSSLPYLQHTECRINNEAYLVPEIDDDEERDSITETAMQFMHVPYLWGGRTHFGIDCSGLSQAVFKWHGIKIDRDASQQARQGQLIEKLSAAQEGDLAFFENKEGRITHVGIMLDNENILHASGKVKIDRIDEEGIYSEELKRYTHKFNCVRRFI